MLHFQLTKNSKTLIFCDFNINILEQSSMKKRHFDIIESLGYRIQNNEPTQKTNLSSSCIDHIITDDDLFCKTYEISISDQYPIWSKVPFWLHSIDQKRIIKYRNLNQLTDQKLLNFLFLLDQNMKKSTESIDGNLVSKIMQTRNRYAPEKKLVITKNRCPWVNKEIKNLLKKRDQARKKWILSDKPKD